MGTPIILNMGAPKLVTKSRRQKPRRIDVLTETSEKSGVTGLAEAFLRRFRTLSFGLLLSPLAVVCCGCVGLAAAPALAWFNFVPDSTKSWPMLLHYAAGGFGIASAYFIFGTSLIFVVPAVNFILPLKPKEFRGP